MLGEEDKRSDRL